MKVKLGRKIYLSQILKSKIARSLFKNDLYLLWNGKKSNCLSAKLPCLANSARPLGEIKFIFWNMIKKDPCKQIVCPHCCGSSKQLLQGHFSKGKYKNCRDVFTFERSRQGYQSEGQPGSTPSRSVEPRTPAERYLCDKKGAWFLWFLLFQLKILIRFFIF